MGNKIPKDDDKTQGIADMEKVEEEASNKGHHGETSEEKFEIREEVQSDGDSQLCESETEDMPVLEDEPRNETEEMQKNSGVLVTGEHECDKGTLAEDDNGEPGKTSVENSVKEEQVRHESVKNLKRKLEAENGSNSFPDLKNLVSIVAERDEHLAKRVKIGLAMHSPPRDQTFSTDADIVNRNNADIKEEVIEGKNADIVTKTECKQTENKQPSYSECKWPLCGKVYINEEFLQKHMKLHQSIEKCQQVSKSGIMLDKLQNKSEKAKQSEKSVQEQNQALADGISARAEQDPNKLIIVWSEDISVNLIRVVHKNPSNVIICIKELDLTKVTRTEKLLVNTSDWFTFDLLNFENEYIRWTLISFAGNFPTALLQGTFNNSEVEQIFAIHAAAQGITTHHEMI